MPKNVKLNRRTVGIQSGADVGFDEASSSSKLFDINPKFSSICKNSGSSRATQTMPANDAEALEDALRQLKREESVEVTIPMQAKSPEVSLSASLLSVMSIDDLKSFMGHYEEVPGTSKVIPFVSHSDSTSIQLENGESSLAVIYNFDEKDSQVSKNSAVARLIENKFQSNLRRISDEAVLLVQDYQSYDVMNTARRQEIVFPRRHRRTFSLGCPVYSCECLTKTIHQLLESHKEGLTRPIPIISDASPSAGVVCRICHEGEEIEPLMRPCLCKGSVGYIHSRCLKVWLEQSNTTRCEICGYPYAIRQTRRYGKCFSITVFLRGIADRRALMYDLVSFVTVTPLCVVGVAMCVRASIASGPIEPTSNFQMGNVTKAGMIMLSTTIIIAYGVWLYTLLSYHYKSWKRWYNSCYEVEVIPVIMTSEERLFAMQRLQEENRRRASRVENRNSMLAILSSSSSYHPYGSFFQRRLASAERVHSLPQ